MHTDDAGTLTQGAMKLEGVFGRDDKTRGAELLFGAGVAPQLEMEVSLARAKDTAMGASTTFHGHGWGVKWVPIQNETGWSVGARFDMGHTRVRDHATPQRFTERETALTALASYRLANAQVLHLNAGHKTVRAHGARHRAATWAVGYEIPLNEQLQLSSEVYGEHRSRPDTAVGLRYAITDGLKASAAVGRGNGRTFSQVGMAWEF
ncbi:MAG: hypothetical protein A2710_12750 [Burkholderiales bacterium RIFCSPHIGHO2_01_FULL_64_960]|nr:MAG: hypothetical protein A2710_12750 [Burkholderiales bacterium RIFCSPHIGHO2_01_FULL_64_960]